MAGIAKDNLSKKEQEFIDKYNKEIKELTDKLSVQERKVIDLLEKEYKKFSSLADRAFDVNVNIAFVGSVHLAQYIGVSESKILKTKSDVDNYFTN